ncbi:MAG: rhomboid family intramembrane serine protease [Thermoplasmatales archaeon]|nr:MAG: rhomboid family intramembrane serine protease [Thermoplasmatales archaeon]
MDIVIFPINLISLICICIMIGAIVFVYLKKFMATYAIIIANFIVFVISLVFAREIIGDLAFRPIYLSLDFFPQIYTLFTSMFLHSTFDFFHIIFNTLMFILIAPHFEGRIGKNKFLGVYLTTGVCAALFHSVLVPFLPSPTPFDPRIGLIGASGAISGVLGAYAYAYPRDRVFFPVGFFIMRIPILFAGVFFIGIQSVYVFIGGDPSIAYLAHIGGFISGVILSAVLIKSGVKEEFKATTAFGYSTNYDPVYSQRPREINFLNLEKLAKTKEQKEMLKKIENETVPQVKDAWLDHFLDKVICPKCNRPLNHVDGKIWCEENHFNMKY